MKFTLFICRENSGFGSSEREERRKHATSEVHTRYKHNENIKNVNAKHGVKNSSVY